MSDTYVKINGVWTKTTRAYKKVSGVWTSVDAIYVKDAGDWEQAFLYDVTPPDAPLIELNLKNFETNFGDLGCYINVSVATEDDDDTLKRIRVLTTYNGAMPSTQYGGTYTSEPDHIFPSEPWSDFYYHGYNSSSVDSDTSLEKTKTWPRNASEFTNLVAGTYYFAAWAEDMSGNWSAGTFTSIVVPKQPTDAEVLKKEQRFTANSSASVKDDGFNFGDAIQSAKPKSNGIYFYGNTISSTIGKDGVATVKNAQIFVIRRTDDGKASANVYLFWHTHPNRDDISNFEIDKHEITKIGTISKGESKWFNLPDSFIANLASGDIKGFGFNWKDPDKTAGENDYSVLKKVGEAPRAGELHVVWTEKP